MTLILLISFIIVISLKSSPSKGYVIIAPYLSNGEATSNLSTTRNESTSSTFPTTTFPQTQPNPVNENLSSNSNTQAFLPKNTTPSQTVNPDSNMSVFLKALATDIENKNLL